MLFFARLRWIGLFGFVTVFSCVVGQEDLSRLEARTALLAERDAKVQKALALANSGELEKARTLLERVYEIESKISDREPNRLFATIDLQARLAHDVQDWEAEIRFRERALELGRQYYASGDYRRKDLQITLDEARAHSVRTEQQRASLAEAKRLRSRAIKLDQQSQKREAIALVRRAASMQADILGQQHPDYAETVNLLGAMLRTMAEYEAAEPLLQQALEIREKTLGKNHPDYLRSLNNLAVMHQTVGRYLQAEPLLVQAKTITEQVVGKDHPLYAGTLHNLAALYHLMSDHKKAEPLLLESVEASKNAFGSDHPSYLTCLNNLATFYRVKEDYSKSELLLRQAGASLAKVRGKEHPQYADYLHDLGVLYRSMRDDQRAEEFFRKAKTIRENVYGKVHPAYANSLRELGSLYVSQGDFQRGEQSLKEALEIEKTRFGDQHPNVAGGLNELSELYRSAGDYSRAETLCSEALSIREKSFGSAHPVYAKSASQLGSLFHEMGDYARAESLFRKVKSIRETTAGKESVDYAQTLNQLGTLYESMGDFSRAELLLREAKAITGRILGKEHSKYATANANLALVYRSMGDVQRAESLYLESKQIREMTLGRDHPSYAVILNNLAKVYVERGEYARAEPLYLEAKRITGKAYGQQHPAYAAVLNNIGFLYHCKGEYARAAPIYLQAIDITFRQLELAAMSQSQQQQIAMNQSVRFHLDSYLNCCLAGKLDCQDAIERVIAWKGSVLARERAIRLGAKDPTINDQFRQLQSLASQIWTATTLVPIPDKIEERRQRLDALVEKRRRLEAELVRTSSAYRGAVRKIGLKEIQQAIPPGSVLVDYFQFSSGGPALVATLITRDNQPRMIALGSSAKAATAIDDWRSSFGMTPRARAAGESLRRQIWDPLVEHLGNADLILVSTDGALGRMPLGVLPGDKPNSYLIEDHRLALIPVPQLLPGLVARTRTPILDQSILLVGDVDYGESKSTALWQRLAGTGQEVDSVKRLLQELRGGNDDHVSVLRSKSASESAFRSAAPNYQLLHLATHDFFLPAKEAKVIDARALTRRSGAAMSFLESSFLSERERGAIARLSPGQLSGVVFAGANESGRALVSAGKGSEDNGIMTADEIRFLPLQNTDLTVLSACETGLGELAEGEGLLGIQRAFQVAGANTVVATMWKVDDQMTRTLMERFYRNLMTRKMSRLDALREAQLWILRNPMQLSKPEDRGAVRERKPTLGTNSQDPAKRTNPSYWAPFVLSGDWR